MENTSYWAATTPTPQPQQSTGVPETCDVAVIGGGITGLTVALQLARAGARVVLFEQHRVGFGASSRNAGMTLTGLKLSPAKLIEQFGLAKAKKLYQTSLDAIDQVEEFVRREQIDCDFRRYGAFWAAYTPSHYAALQGSQRLLKESFDHDTQLVPRNEMPSELGSKYYYGGLVDPKSAGLNPAKWVAGLWRKAEEAGVQCFESARVEGVEPAGADQRIRTSVGQTRAATVVAATNGYTPDCLPFLRRRIIPIGSYIIVTEPLGPALARELIPNGRMVFDSKKYLFYFRLVEGNRLLFGHVPVSGTSPTTGPPSPSRPP
jgi:glycine/D-amino acid oxidase-like deaminating enzyme